MVTKQTQTKLFDFSDVGLDFCAGSKNLFPDRFKKMLSVGYNVQTVSSVAIVGNQVTFTYGGAHGYAQDRVLKVDSGALASINNGEFWIDSITTNTVTFTLDGTPSVVEGGFATRIASLAWSLEYENANVHIYKFKHIDETDMFIRFVYQNNAAYRNAISVCIGKSVDLSVGTITDLNSLELNRANTTPVSGPNWEFTSVPSSIYNNYTYNQGLSVFGLGRVVGSAYHVAFLFNILSQPGTGRVFGVFPFAPVANYSSLNYPAIFVEDAINHPMYDLNYRFGLFNTRVYVGAQRCMGDQFRSEYNRDGRFYTITPRAYQSFTKQDSFNTSIAQPFILYESPSDQFLGYIQGIYICSFNAVDTPPIIISSTPSITMDVDLNSLVVIGHLSVNTSSGACVFLALPVEEIKIAT